MRASVVRRRFRRSGAAALALGVILGMMGLLGGGASGAPGTDNSVDFVAAGPNTYVHQPAPIDPLVDPFGYQHDTISRDTGVVRSLEGGDYTCGDIVPFFALINPTDDATTVTASFDFDRYPTANQQNVKLPGVGYRDVYDVIVSPDESEFPGGASTAVESFTTATVNGEDQMHVDVVVAHVPDAGFVLRLDVVVGCDTGADPKANTGTIQARFVDWVVDGEAQKGGDQTITMKSASAILEERGTLVVVKDAVPNDAQDFTFRLDKPDETSATFTLDDDSDATLTNSTSFQLPAGDYDVTETDIPASWVLTGVECGGAQAAALTAAAPTVSVSVVADETVTCTFTNTKETPSSSTTVPYVPPEIVTTTVPPTTTTLPPTTTTSPPATVAPTSIVAPTTTAPAVSVLGEQLARTGSTTPALLAMAALCLVLGSALLVAGRQRSSRLVP